MNPKISVIVPVYNVERYLARCLDSLVGQTLRQIEIICVDDGSRDGSPAVLAVYAAQDNRAGALYPLRKAFLRCIALLLRLGGLFVAEETSESDAKCSARSISFRCCVVRERVYKYWSRPFSHRCRQLWSEA